MLQDHKQEQENVKRSLERLKDSMNTKSIEQLLPAMAFTINLLDQYVSSEPNHIKTSYYQIVMTKIVEEFKIKIQNMNMDSSRYLTKNKKKIIDDILVLLVKQQKKAKQQQSYVSQHQAKQKIVLDNLYRDIQKYYQQHNLDKAYSLILQLKDVKSKLAYFKYNLTEQTKARLQKIQNQYLRMIQNHSYLSTQNWIFDKEQDGITLQYKVIQQQKTISVRMYAQVDLQILPFLAITSEIDFQKHFVPFVYYSQQLKSLGRNKKAGYTKTYVPLLTDRQCYFYAVGYDRMETTGSIFLYTETYDQNEEVQRQYDLFVPKPQDSEFVRLKVSYFCLDFKPVSKTRAQIKMVTKADFKLPFLPLFILQKTARFFTFTYFQNIVKQAKNYKGSAWEERVQKNPTMYNFFQSKIDKYFE